MKRPLELHPDVRVVDHGSVVQFWLITDRARSWVEENVQTESWQWQAGRIFAVDHRFAGDLVAKMWEADLEVS